MQIYYEDNYPTEDYIKGLLLKNFENINSIVFNFYFYKICRPFKGYFGEWEEFYYSIYYQLVHKISKEIIIDRKKLDIIYKKLIIRRFVRSFIVHCIYKPGGRGYLCAKKNFYNLVKCTDYKI